MNRPASLFTLVLTLPLASCINAQTYGTPRTLGPGKIQTTVGLDVQTYSSKILKDAIDENGEPAIDEEGNRILSRQRGAAVTTPLLPSVGVRIGAVEGFDLGLRLASGSSIELNGKVNFLRTRYFDMAVMPGAQIVRANLVDNNPFGDASGQAFFFHVPLLMGINVTPTSTILLNTGGAYMKTASSVDDARKAPYVGYGDPGLPDYSGEGKDPDQPKTSMDKKARTPTSRSAAFIRAGLGFNQRIGRRLSIQPEISFLISPDDVSTQIINFGIGFNIGAQPAYTRGASDEWSEDEAVDRPEAVDKSEGKADVDPEEERIKTKPAKIKIEQDPYEVEKERKPAEEKKAEEEAERKRIEEEEKAAEEAEKKKKKKKK